MSGSAGSLGSVLLQPNRLARAEATDTDAALVQDFLSALVRVGGDKAIGGSVVQVIEEAFEAMAGRLLDRAGGGLTRAVQHMQDLARPVAAFVQGLPSKLPESEDPGEIASALVELLSSLAGTAAGLSIERIREVTTSVMSVLQEDLGLTTAVLTEEVWSLFDDLIARLEAVPPEDDAAVRSNRRSVIGVLRRLKRRMRGAFVLPELKADRLASVLFDELRSGGAAEVLGKIACAGKEMAGGLTVARDVLTLVPFTGFGPHSVGPAEALAGVSPHGPPEGSPVEYLWYASWLLGGKDVDWYELWKPKADLWIDRRGTMVEVRRRDHRLFLGDEMQWGEIPNGPLPADVEPTGDRPAANPPLRYTFRHVSPEGMEVWARHLAWITDDLEAVLHVWSPLAGLTITKGGQVSVTDLLNVIANAGHVTFDIAKEMPFGFWVLRDRRLGDHWYGRPVAFAPTFLANFPGTFQGFHTNASGGYAFLWWLLLVMSDVMNAYGANALAGAPRNVLLSFLTLLNYDGPSVAPIGEDDRPDNRKEMDGILGIFNLLGSLVLSKVFVPREDYAHPVSGPGGHAAAMWLGYMVLGGILMGTFVGFIGTAFVQALMAVLGSPAVDWAVLGMNIVKSMVAIGLPFWLTLYGFKENDTDGGKWNPDGGAAFDGYPGNADSPYLLPWAKGGTIMCFQGNQGMFSHHVLSNMNVYCYDFMLDKGDEVLAMRPGTVVDYFDWVPDYENKATPAGPEAIAGQTPNDNWNCVVIRHDQDSAPAHDLGPGGGAVQSYAVYGHGLNGSVRKVFGDRGAAPGNIIGTVVQRGQPVMLADSTGNSFCDHVHVEIHTGPAASQAPPVAQSALGARIPFAFKEVGRNAGLSPTAGVPGSRTWHESGNERVP